MSEILGNLKIRLGDNDALVIPIYGGHLFLKQASCEQMSDEEIISAFIDEQLYIILGEEFIRPDIEKILNTQGTGSFINNYSIEYNNDFYTKFLFKTTRVLSEKGYFYNSYVMENRLAASVAYVPILDNEYHYDDVLTTSIIDAESRKQEIDCDEHTATDDIKQDQFNISASTVNDLKHMQLMFQKGVNDELQRIFLNRQQ